MIAAQPYKSRSPYYKVEDGVIITNRGDYACCFQLNLPEIFTLSKSNYVDLQHTWEQAINSLPYESVVHKQDYFRREKYKSDHINVDDFLENTYELAFNERPYIHHNCFVYLIKRAENRKKVTSLSSSLFRKSMFTGKLLDEKEQAEFWDGVIRFEKTLANFDKDRLTIQRLDTDDILGTDNHIGVLEQYLFLNSSEVNELSDVSYENGIHIGTKTVNLHTLADLRSYPEAVGPRINYDQYSSDNSKFSVGFSTQLGLLLDENHIYNQVIYIPHPDKYIKKYEKKGRRLYSLMKKERSNQIAHQAVNNFLNQYYNEDKKICLAHFNVMSYLDAGTPEKNAILKNKVKVAFNSMSADPKLETVGHSQIHYACFPGNAAEMPENEMALLFTDIASCLLNNETNYKSSLAPIGVKLGDRLTGRPVNVDMFDEPRDRGWIDNRNVIMVGGSGSGKSMCNNRMMQSHYKDGAHIVMVDVGHSYKGLCEMLGGYYYTFSEDEPIEFNPFYLKIGDRMTTERIENLKSLLLSLWKKNPDEHEQSEYVALSTSLKMYYEYIENNHDIFPCFNTYYDFCKEHFQAHMDATNIREQEFDIINFLYNLTPFYKGGEFDYLLNATKNLDILNQRFIVFELDNIKDHPVLFPVVTLMIMDVFIDKMRRLGDERKIIMIEEAWKAIMKEGMANFIKYLYKTVRKFNGSVGVVTQEIDDLLASPIIKETIITNADIKILLDHKKFANDIDKLIKLYKLSEEEAQILLSLNKANDPTKKYKEVFISFNGVQFKAYRVELSREQYIAYTTEKPEKETLAQYLDEYSGDYRVAITQLSRDLQLGNVKW